MAESEIVENSKKVMPPKRVGYFKMKVVSNNAEIKSDDSKYFVKIKNIIKSHYYNIVLNEDIKKVSMGTYCNQ